MQITNKCFLPALAMLCLICSIKAYVLPDDIKDGDGFEELCHNNDPASPVNTAECKKVIDETSTAYTGTNYTLPSTTPLSVKNNDVIATTATSKVPNLTDHSNNKSQRAVQQANSTGGMVNSKTMTSTSAVISSTTSTPVPVIASNDTEVTTKETFVLTADHVASKSQSEVTSSTTVVPGESTSASSTPAPKSGSMAVVTNVALLALLLALATILH